MMKVYQDHLGKFWHFLDFLDDLDMEICFNIYYQGLFDVPMEYIEKIILTHNLRLER